MLNVCVPTVAKGTGDIFAYPPYSDHGVQSLFTTGTYMAVYALLAWASSSYGLNKKFTEDFYQLCAGKGWFAGINLGFFTYLCHFFFIMVLMNFFVKPLNIKPPLTVVVLLLGSSFLSFVLYWILAKIKQLF